MPTTESAVLLVMGVAQLSLIRIVQEPNPTVAVTLAQQMCALLLRGLGVPNPEGEAIAAQAADEIVRRGAFTPDLDGAVQ